MKKLVVLYGPSASGKTTVEKELLEVGNLENKIYENIVSLTTRKPREYEVNGKDYIFCKDRLDFIDHKPFAYIKIANNSDWLYGINKESFNKIQNIGVISVISADYVDDIIIGAKDFISFDDVHLFFITADKEVRKQRLLERGESLDNIQTRFSFEDTMSEKDFEARYGWISNKQIFDTTQGNLTSAEIVKYIMESVEYKN